MWDCPDCGTKAVAASVEECPGCGAGRPKENVAEPSESQPEERADETSDAFPSGGDSAPPLPKRTPKASK